MVFLGQHQHAPPGDSACKARTCQLTQRTGVPCACAGASLAADGSAAGQVNATVPSPGAAGLTGNSNSPTNTSVVALPGLPGMGGAGGAYINLFTGKVTYGGGGGGGSVGASRNATYLGGAGARWHWPCAPSARLLKDEMSL
jgi:hypothetical protein